jgi:hypothetical protein
MNGRFVVAMRLEDDSDQTLYGPFNSEESAREWAEFHVHHNGGEWEAYRLISPFGVSL